MQTQEHATRRWLRLLAATPSCLFSAIFVAVQIPAVREAVGIANSIYRFIDSTVPSLGIAAIWLGFVLIVGGAIATWQTHRGLKDGTTKKMIAEGSAVLTVALGVLVALVSTFSQPVPANTKAPGSYQASVTKRHRYVRRHRHHALAHHSSSSGTSKPSSPSPASKSSTPTPAPAPSPAPPAGGSSSTSGGGGGNTVTINKTTEQIARTGNAEGSGAESGPATNNNEESTNISIG